MRLPFIKDVIDEEHHYILGKHKFKKEKVLLPCCFQETMIPEPSPAAEVQPDRSTESPKAKTKSNQIKLYLTEFATHPTAGTLLSKGRSTCFFHMWKKSPST